MDTILLLTPAEADGSVPRAALEALGAARTLGAPVTAGVFGGTVEKAAASRAGTGVQKVLTADHGPGVLWACSHARDLQ